MRKLPCAPVSRLFVLSLCALALASLAVAGCGDDPQATNPAGQYVADANDSGSIQFDVGQPGDTGSATKDVAVAPKDTATGPEDTGNTTVDAGTMPSCVGKCGGYDAAAPCQCNSSCEAKGDCCPDYAAVCKADEDVTTTDAGGDGGGGGLSCAGICGKYVSGAACQCDDGCSGYGDCCDDYDTLCADADAVGTDTTKADTATTPDAGSADAASGPSCVGQCGKFNSNSSCQCDGNCKQFGDCCGDYDAVCGGGDCKDAADCDDKLDCTDDKCDAGKCVHTTKADACLIDDNCQKDGAQGLSACLKCDPKQNQEAWTILAGQACDDSNNCTDNDLCDASGVCAGTKNPSCCATDKDCVGNSACEVGTCDAAAGKCKFETKADCCQSGVCCDAGTKGPKTAGTPCGGEAASVEYKCDGKQVLKREAFPGCDGKSADTCSSDKANWSWSEWLSILTCTDKQKCVEQAGAAPTCQDETAGGCKTAQECDDGNACTTDTCSAGSCKHAVVAECCNFDSDCSDNNKCTVDQCDSNHKCLATPLPCEGSSDCELAACDPNTGKCSVNVKPGMCKIGDSCLKDGDLKSDDPCMGCVADTSTSDWSVSAKCACKSGVCCDTVAGKIKEQAAKCDDVVKLSEYRCTQDGKAVEIRQAFRGCTGKSNTCSTSASNYSWTAWQTQQTCKANEVCEVADASKPGVCKTTVVTACTPNTTCCDAKGQYAAQSTKCGTSILKSEFKCDGTAKGGKILVRRAFSGCTGKSTTCSTSSSNYAWAAWETYKTCPATDVCEVTAINTPGVCKLAQQCTPGTKCCDDKGNYAAKATKCGVTVLKSKWSCSDSEKGGKVLISKAYGGCTGTSTYCSYATTNFAWSTPEVDKQCGSNQVCSVSDELVPGVCKDVVDALCLKTDAYEAGTSTANSFSLGSYTDTSATKILNPKVHFKSETDKDYLKYHIADSKSVNLPKLDIEWDAGQQVTLCAYYACDKGAGGKDCKKVTCPTGFKSSTSSAVSAQSGNGCCVTTPSAKGKLSWLPEPSTGADRSGWVYFNVQNAAAICQEASIKLTFAHVPQTACKPGTTCCDDQGNIMAQKTKCSSTVMASEYKCSSTAAGGDVMVRKAYRGCIGSSAYCSISSSNYSWTDWAVYQNCSTSQVCSVTAIGTPGTCKAAVDPLCGKLDKYEATSKSIIAPYNLGNFTDTSAALLLSPNAHFYNSYDSDYFRYHIADNTNLTNPKVHIEFEGTAEKVSVCAWYRCDKGAGGKDCAPVKCPAGTTASLYSYVSGGNPNGCCMTAQKGTLAWSPSAAGTDESGWVYFRLTNAGPVCQEVKTKLVFGSQSATQCTPDTQCCTGSGTWAAKNTKCGTTALATEYKCSSSANGAAVQSRKAYAGCTGSSTTCSTLTSYQSWTAWSTYKQCGATEVCSVTSTNTPGTCKPAVSPLCSKADPYDNATSATTAYDLGTKDDTSAAIFLSPGVHFDSKYDYEYFRYKINDKLNLTDPKVQVDWTGSDQVMVCAYYRCEKGAGGKDCAPQKCPAGTTASYNFTVSSTNNNGCCMTATKGGFGFNPNAAGTTDETGWAYLRFANASNICQEVSVKLTFGSQSQTQCNPNTTCCTAAGTYAAKNTKCGTGVLDTEYKCSSTAQGGDVLVRNAYAGCTGTSTSCSTSSTYKSWSDWAVYKNCSTSEVCSVTSTTIAGTCKTVGSAGPICGKVDKYEGGYSTSTAYDLGTFNDSADAVVLNPDVHFKSTYDSDYFKWSIKDATNLSQPKVDVSWTASESLEVCAWYRCNAGSAGKNCEPVKCPSGTVASYNSLVSTASPNGCCLTGKQGAIAFSPNAAGSTDETGWGYMRVSNKAQVCQWVNTKIAFGGSTKACGDGKYESGESTCLQDQGTCLGKCGKYTSGAKCQCDDKCTSIGDCCWDKNLLCDG